MTMLKKQLEFEEGRKLHAYICPAGYKTIGVGHNLEANPRFDGELIPDQIDDDFCDKLLDNDIKSVELQLRSRWFGFNKILPGARRDAAINMAFQMGVSGFLGFKKMVKALETGNWNKAYDEALDSDWARQTPQRAKRVAGQLRSGQYYKC